MSISADILQENDWLIKKYKEHWEFCVFHTETKTKCLLRVTCNLILQFCKGLNFSSIVFSDHFKISLKKSYVLRTLKEHNVTLTNIFENLIIMLGYIFSILKYVLFVLIMYGILLFFYKKTEKTQCSSKYNKYMSVNEIFFHIYQFNIDIDKNEIITSTFLWQLSHSVKSFNLRFQKSRGSFTTYDTVSVSFWIIVKTF